MKSKEAGLLSLFFTPNIHQRFYDADKFDVYWKRLLKKLFMPYRVKYNIRHTFAMLMIDSYCQPNNGTQKHSRNSYNIC